MRLTIELPDSLAINTRGLSVADSGPPPYETDLVRELRARQWDDGRPDEFFDGMAACRYAAGYVADWCARNHYVPLDRARNSDKNIF